MRWGEFEGKIVRNSQALFIPQASLAGGKPRRDRIVTVLKPRDQRAEMALKSNKQLRKPIARRAPIQPSATM